MIGVEIERSTLVGFYERRDKFYAGGASARCITLSAGKSGSPGCAKGLAGNEEVMGITSVVVFCYIPHWDFGAYISSH